MKRFLPVLLTSAVLGGLTLKAQSAPGYYTLIDLGTFGGIRADMRTISSTGTIAANAIIPSGGTTVTDAVIYKSGLTYDIGALFPSTSFVAGISSVGSVAGAWVTSLGQNRLFSLDGTGFHDLGNSFQNPIAINSTSQVLASATIGGAAILNPDGTHTSLPLAFVTGINDSGDVSGTLSIVPPIPPATHAAIWLHSGGIIDIASLGLSDNGSAATALNNVGQAVGTYNPVFNLSKGFAYRDGMVLSVPDFGDSLFPTAVNNHGYAVGYAYYPDGRQRAFVFDGVETFDLNTLLDSTAGLELQTATGINDLGQIVGNGLASDGTQHGFLLTLTPTTTAQCGIDVTSQIRVTQAQFRIPASPLVYQLVAIQNVGTAPIERPLTLVMGGLQNGIYLNPHSNTACFSPRGEPFLTIPASASGLQAGQYVLAAAWFADTTIGIATLPVSYAPRVLSGVPSQ